MPKRVKQPTLREGGTNDAKLWNKAKRQVMSSNGIKLTSNGINVADGFQHLVGRAEHGDPHAQKQLRNGKYALPHLRNFSKLPELKGEMLIDNFISALTTHPKHLYANYKSKENQRTMKHLALFLKRAHRFKVDDDLVERVLFESAHAGWEKIFTVINNAIPPFDNMWIEGERNSRLFQRWRNDETHFAPEWVGWHIQRGGAVRGYEVGSTYPDCLIKPTKVYGTSDDTIVVQKYMKPMRHAVENLSYFIPKTCYVFTSKNHIKTMPPHERTVEKSFKCFGEAWAKEIKELAPTHIRQNLSKRVLSQISVAYTLDDYGLLLKDTDILGPTLNASTDMYEDDIRLLAWLFSELNFAWRDIKPIRNPTRKNRAHNLINPTIDLKTIEIELPKPRGIVLRPKTPSEDGCRKLHWVIGHMRQYKDGRTVWIKPYQRGNAKYGEVIKDYSLKKKAS